MSADGRGALFSRAAGMVVAATASLAPIEPVSAQGIFETIFGDLRRAIERPARAPDGFVDPFTSLFRALSPRPARQPQQQQRAHADTAPAEGFCVRTCDGRYFAVQAHPGVGAQEMCRAFCPASETRLYSGGDIDYATTSDGSRYADLGNAYLYRSHLVAGCTCNGRDPFGLAPIDINRDPTLRPGDVVATRRGLMAFTGHNNNTANFTPVDSYPGLARSTRAKLSAMKITPPHPGAPAEIPSAIAPPSQAAQVNDGTGPQRAR